MVANELFKNDCNLRERAHGTAACRLHSAYYSRSPPIRVIIIIIIRSVGDLWPSNTLCMLKSENHLRWNVIYFYCSETGDKLPFVPYGWQWSFWFCFKKTIVNWTEFYKYVYVCFYIYEMIHYFWLATL